MVRQAKPGKEESHVVEAHRQSAVVQAEAGDAEAALEHALAALRGSPAPSRELDLLLSESAIRALAAEPAWEEVHGGQ